MPEDLHRRLLREHERWQVLERQIKDLENERRQRIRRDDTAHVAKVRSLLEFWGVGLNANCLPGVALTIASKWAAAWV